MLENKMMRESSYYWQNSERQMTEFEWRVRYAQSLAERASVAVELHPDHLEQIGVTKNRNRSIWTMALDGRLGAAMLRMM
jgi:hypothetical protein